MFEGFLFWSYTLITIRCPYVSAARSESLSIINGMRYLKLGVKTEGALNNRMVFELRGLMLDMYDFENDIWLCHSFGGQCFNATLFDRVQSEYAVTNDDARNGTLFGALAEAAFLIGLERNRLDLPILLVSYYENDIDCRCFLQLAHFGEKFDSSTCQKTCDNCLKNTSFIEKDVIEIAKQLVELVKLTGQKVSSSHILEVYHGSLSQLACH
ncbi:hypothetical protein AHAS_Ahas20G0113200 [Arachis hypogaea]